MKITTRKRMIGTIPALEMVEESHRNVALPLIVFYHGWRINKYLIATQGRKLARAGFRVVIPDAENHGDRFQEVSPIPSLTFFNSIHTNLFEFEYLINYFKERRLTDGRIGVGGLSMGGMTTCALLTHQPDIMAAACLMGTPKLTAYRNRIYYHVQRENIFLPKDYEELTDWIPRYDLSKHADKLGKRPLFFWHGDEDRQVPINQVREFVSANPDLNLEVHFEHAGHLVTTATMDKTTAFFTREMLKG